MLKRIDDIVMIKLSGTDSNIYLIDDAAIDAGTGFNFTRLATMLNVVKKSLGDIREVVNTHGHFDHVGGNGYFINARVKIHEADADILEKGDEIRSVADFFDGKLRPRKVDVKLKDGDAIKIGTHELEVIHAPGHSAGSICLYDRKEKLLFSGDTVFADGIGRTDLPGSDPEAMKRSLEKLQGLKVDKILPGHGDPVLEKAGGVLKAAKEMTEWI
jgi:glyoxylase-like metal-dependent hydrolase (beta-lactamase superfamily II)